MALEGASQSQYPMIHIPLVKTNSIILEQDSAKNMATPPQNHHYIQKPKVFQFP